LEVAKPPVQRGSVNISPLSTQIEPKFVNFNNKARNDDKRKKRDKKYSIDNFKKSEQMIRMEKE
jgi:hypothetical protein